jgi:hypothetical protein
MIRNTVADAFSQKELIEIYHKAGSVEEEALIAAAKELFPQRMAAEQPPMLRVETGLHGRRFLRHPEDETVETPAYTLKSGQCQWVGIMEDGEAIPY